MKGGTSKRPYRAYTVSVDEVSTGKNSSSSGKNDNCDSIDIDVALTKTQTSVSNLAVGDILKVVLDSNTLGVKKGRQAICGYIVSTKNAQIITCIEAGKKFKATLLTKKNKTYNVRIQIDK